MFFSLTIEELHEIIDKAGLFTTKVGFYKLDVELEKILQASFPKAEDVNKIRDLFAEDGCKLGLLLLIYSMNE